MKNYFKLMQLMKDKENLSSLINLTMKQISIHVPDTQLSFMMELLQKFDFVKIDIPADFKGVEFTMAQKVAVEAERSACKKNADYLLDWESVKNNLNDN